MGIDKASLIFNENTKEYALTVFNGDHHEVCIDKIDGYDEWQIHEFFGFTFDIHFDFDEEFSVSIYRRYKYAELYPDTDPDDPYEFTDHNNWINPVMTVTGSDDEFQSLINKLKTKI